MTDIPPPHHRRRGHLFAGLRASFLTGLVVILPIGLTIWLIWSVVGWIDGWVLPLVPAPYQPDSVLRHYLGEDTIWNVRGLGVVLFLAFTILVGWIAKGMIGRSLIRIGERVVDRMPVVRSIYNGLKQIAETVFAQSETNFEKVCLIQYPRPGIWAVGFVSTRAKAEIADKLGPDEILSVFLPTTPNPTSGFLLYVPSRDVILMDMSIEEGAKLIISAGLVVPPPRVPAAVAGDAPPKSHVLR